MNILILLLPFRLEIDENGHTWSEVYAVAVSKGVEERGKKAVAVVVADAQREKTC